MSIKYAVLGLIAEEPRHGYAVRAAFEERLGDFWELNYGQIYQVLAALELEGLITGTGEQVGRRPPRTVYTISAKGRDALRRWLELPLTSAKPFRDDFYVRLLFVTDPRDLDALLKARVGACERRLAEVIAQQRFLNESSPTEPARRLFAAATILHAEADAKAAAMCQTLFASTSRAQRTPSESSGERKRTRGRT